MTARTAFIIGHCIIVAVWLNAWMSPFHTCTRMVDWGLGKTHTEAVTLCLRERAR